MTRYRTIVADPPWHYDGFAQQGNDAPHKQDRERGAPPAAVVRVPLPYPSMTVAEIAEIPVASMAATSIVSARKPRTEHSRKPDVFLDLVETVSPGPYLELFARRNRLGWDTWGDQALEHVEMA